MTVSGSSRFAATPRASIATERLSRLADGRLLHEIRHPWRDGTTHVGFEPLKLLEKLAAFVLPPRHNLVQYHGFLAPAVRHKARIVPSASALGPDPAPARSGSGLCRSSMPR